MGFYDESVRLYNCLTYQFITEFPHPREVKKEEEMFIFQECPLRDEGSFAQK